MGSTLSFKYKEVIPRLQLIADTVSPGIVLSAVVDSARIAQTLAMENNLLVIYT
jgi:hypothetical protein